MPRPPAVAQAASEIREAAERLRGLLDGDDGPVPDHARMAEAARELQAAAADRHQAELRYRRAVEAWNAASAELADARSGPVTHAAVRAAEIDVLTFGSFRVVQGTAPVELPHNRAAQTVLRYLATHPHRAEVPDVLMDVLWPTDAEDVARHKLHVACSMLRSALGEVGGEPYLRHVRGRYELRTDLGVSIDSARFLELHAEGSRVPGRAASAFAEAVEIADGVFLPDDLYADWAVGRRERVTLALRSMLRFLAAHHAVTGSLDAAARYAERAIEESPTDEAAHRLLMRLHVARGRRPDAIRQYQACERILADELAVAPSDETRALLAQIAEGTLERADAIGGDALLIEAR